MCKESYSSVTHDSAVRGTIGVNMTDKVLQIADTIKHENGEEFIIAQSWEHDKHTDFLVINRKTGVKGSLRILNKESICP